MTEQHFYFMKWTPERKYFKKMSLLGINFKGFLSFFFPTRMCFLLRRFDAKKFLWPDRLNLIWSMESLIQSISLSSNQLAAARSIRSSLAAVLYREEPTFSLDLDHSDDEANDDLFAAWTWTGLGCWAPFGPLDQREPTYGEQPHVRDTVLFPPTYYEFP